MSAKNTAVNLMIVVSDNTATNLLIDLLTPERIRDVTRAHGWTGTYLRGKLQVPAAPGAGPVTPSQTTPADLADHFARLWRGELLPPELTDVAKRIYRAQQFTELGRASSPMNLPSALEGCQPLMLMGASCATVSGV